MVPFSLSQRRQGDNKINKTQAKKTHISVIATITIGVWAPAWRSHCVVDPACGMNDDLSDLHPLNDKLSNESTDIQEPFTFYTQ